MPSVAPRRRSRSVYEDHDEEQSSPSEAAKRQRIEEVKEEDEDEEDPTNTQRRRRQTNGASSTNGHDSVNGFKPGAIIRVKVKNFVTYEHAEFFPGPNLNMVIGPNGTGKSSLVCAICLGLAFPPKTLGRADKVGDFVKHGKDVAIIEIELQKRPNDRANHVVSSYIAKEDGKMRYRLNGKDVPKKTIEKLTKSLHIQVDNLCQFLPQDKVAEFAGLTPVDLLRETLRAVAEEEMIERQEQLTQWHKTHKDIKQSLDTHTENLRASEARQQGLQADVDRLHEREDIKKRIDEWQTARLCAVYQEIVDRHKDAKKQKKENEKRLKELERACGPALEAVNSKKDYQARIDSAVAARKKALKNAELAADQALQVVDSRDEECQQIQDKLAGEQTSFNARKNELGRIRSTITTLENKQKKKPPEFEPAEWNRRIREKERLREEIQTSKRQIDSQLSEIKQQGRAVSMEIKALEQNIEHLDSQEGQQLSQLKSINPDAAKGWEWLQQHQDEFEKEIFGPPMLTCSLKNNQYSDLVQSLLQRNDFECFTAQTRNDHKKLSDQFYDRMGLSVTIRTVLSDFESFRPPMTAEEAHQLGLDGFAIDYLEGPKPVLAMLCAERHLHGSGVGLRDISTEQYNELYNGQKISQWATGHTYYRVLRRREYGPDATTTSARRVNPGRFWTDQPVDNAEKAELQRKMQEKIEEKRELHSQYKETEAELNDVKSKEPELEAELTELKKQKSEFQKEHTLWAALPEKIKTEKENEAAKKASMTDCRSRMFTLSEQIDDVLLEKAKAALRHKDLVSRVRDAHQALLDAQIRLIEAKSDVQGLEERNAEMTRSLAERKEAIKNFARNAEILRKEAEAAGLKLEPIASRDGPDAINHYREMATGKTPEDIDVEIDAETNKLSLIHAVDEGVLRQFEKRAREIQELTKRKEDATKKLERLDHEIQSLREQWEPRLDELVSQINEAFGHNFEQISCAGEVGVYKDEDFDKWAIEIKVKFRENESLQQLDQHRQSGGERAVSTIFYLMALQSMAQAPFRVVDEINQGMDPRNERMVHERMVEIACREHTSQYFLITPKLLTGLRYDERMRVLCIASGEHVPVEARKLDFRKLLAKKRELKTLKAAA